MSTDPPRLEDNNVWPWRTDTEGDAVTLLLVGDTNLQNRDHPAEAFSRVLPTLRAADVLFGHLEGLLSTPSAAPAVPDIPYKSGWRHSDPAMVEGLTAAGFAAVSCASNVTYGSSAILDSLAALEGAGIASCGAGRNLEEAHRPAVVLRNGISFGFLSYTSVFWPVGHAAGPATPGVATIKATSAYQPHPRTLEMPGVPPTVITRPDEQELQRMVENVRRLRERVDVVVVSCHWGVSESHQVTDYQRIIGRAAIDAGADVVIGHHPHVLQGVEIWHHRPIFYSLGNFAFDWDRKDMLARKDGLLVHCVIHRKRLAQVSFVPARRNNDNLIELLRPDERIGREMAEQVRSLSAEFGTELSVEGSEVVVGDGSLWVTGRCR